MITQMNLKFKDDFYQVVKQYADSRGYMSVQELIREAVRDKIFDNLDMKESYKQVLQSDDANTFLGEKESEDFLNKLRKKSQF